MTVLLLLMNWSESQAQKPGCYPVGMKNVPDGQVWQMEEKNQL